MKVVFLDIDGVLQPRTSKRQEHRKEIPAFCRMMDKRVKGLYHQYRGPKMCTCELVGEKRY